MSKFPSDIKAASKFLSDHGFEYYGEINRKSYPVGNGGNCVFFRKEELFYDDRQGYIYFWIKVISGLSVELVYVGSTDREMSKRCADFENGINYDESTPVNLRHYYNINTAIDNDCILKVYALKKAKSDVLTRIDTTNIKKIKEDFCPSWNV